MVTSVVRCLTFRYYLINHGKVDNVACNPTFDHCDVETKWKCTGGVFRIRLYKIFRATR